MTVTFDTSVWSQQRNIVKVTGIAATSNYIQLTFGALVAKYYGDAAGNLDIDVSELVRTSSTGTFSLQEYNSAGTAQGSAVSKTWQVIGLIKPNRGITPPVIDNFTTNLMTNEDNAPILFPSVMYENAFGIDYMDRGEIYFDVNVPTPPNTAYDTLQYPNQPTSPSYTELSKNTPHSIYTWRTHRLSTVTRIIHTIQLRANNVTNYTYTWKLKPLVCGKTYASVQWISRSGVIKRHTFEVRNIKYLADGSTSYLTIDNSFSVHKGQAVSMDLVLDGLNRYDYWYYSDIITSNDVRVALVPEDYVSASDKILEECRVDVKTNSLTIPDGDAGDFNTLSINVNYKRYDEI